MGGVPQADLYPNGKPRETYRMENGKIEGEVVHYSPSGQVIERAEFKTGVLEGKVTYEAVAEAHGLEYSPLDDVLPLTPV